MCCIGVVYCIGVVHCIGVVCCIGIVYSIEVVYCIGVVCWIYLGKPRETKGTSVLNTKNQQNINS